MSGSDSNCISMIKLNCCLQTLIVVQQRKMKIISCFRAAQRKRYILIFNISSDRGMVPQQFIYTNPFGDLES